ncbi:hypothetical protein [Colwellia sp. MB3u-4]|uniref:hypothetical protein n=1 Tax=Colwellia sp. MB3u-4 TaxID=2759822 RepID=UPI0015F7706F|nr:hypothetical protein [Colwellia sp. MB3u-4]MBA6288837.1 hypothetical protein [Colwellia sp. MB3u-4]
MVQKYKKITCVSLLILSSFSALAEDSTSLGLSLGSPAGANFVIKSDELDVPLQISGGYWGDKISGIEVGYNFYQNNDSFFHSAQIISGYSDIEKNKFKSDKWKYVGFSATLKKGGFFMEPGLTFGSGDYSSPQFTFQIGWLWGL